VHATSLSLSLSLSPDTTQRHIYRSISPEDIVMREHILSNERTHSMCRSISLEDIGARD
jgi:hypothetical protein